MKTAQHRDLSAPLRLELYGLREAVLALRERSIVLQVVIDGSREFKLGLGVK